MITKKQIKLALASSILVNLILPSIARAEWVFLDNGKAGPVYLNNRSVYIRGNLRSAEVKYKGFGRFGRVIMVINCNNYNYYLESSYGSDRGYARPGTVGGIIADEVCDNYFPAERNR